ncbi:MAG: hypothetical protein DWQ31_13080 [Planctomycetota bacterium]|nr:MAG: hypothetical protein DWQ31_13080 [Planctomycetota bacterium]REJ95240.1 MAG: hypothetical protein DWQ35_06800 [Planctomycetota bacterium]REK27014.1 MAG: hypothetical protein DWQ42_08115 [Planctomycetota bacterium]REK40313.1 MAG: hypothetical protein DWQ46_16705 [Planctomycetota bacterium]
MKTLGIVQAQGQLAAVGGGRLRKLGGVSLLEWVVRRTTESELLDQVVVVTSEGNYNETAAAVPNDVAIFVGRQNDRLGQFCEAIDEYRPDHVVRICLDNPFTDPSLIDRLIITASEHPLLDYVGYCAADGRPALFCPAGVFSEWFTAEALQKADRESTDPQERNDITRYIQAHPELFHVRLIPAPAPLARDDLRLRVDLSEDWEHAEAICDALGPDELDWQGITRFLEHQPHIRRRMATLNRDADSRLARQQ